MSEETDLRSRLPRRVTTESAELAIAEIRRRENALAKTHGEDARSVAGQMALAQAYERIADLEGQLSRVEYPETGEVMRPSCGCQGPSATLWKCTHLVPAEGSRS